MKRQLRCNNAEARELDMMEFTDQLSKAKEREMMELIDQLSKDVGYGDLVFNFADYFGMDEVLTALREMTVSSHRDHLY